MLTVIGSLAGQSRSCVPDSWQTRELLPHEIVIVLVVGFNIILDDFASFIVVLQIFWKSPAVSPWFKVPYRAPSLAAFVIVMEAKNALPRSKIPAKMSTINGKIRANSTILCPLPRTTKVLLYPILISALLFNLDKTCLNVAPPRDLEILSSRV